ncbi:hypothetical protein JD76_01289 [Micromonospora endolithica]|nr:hypothetical protein JD76_01289 [Micromonospora endolithica]
MYRFIAAEKTTYPVRLLCRLLGGGHSAFYDWLRAGRQRAVERERQDRHRVEVTRQASSEHRGVYGARHTRQRATTGLKMSLDSLRVSGTTM